MKKKVISILLTAVLATGMAACGSNSNTADNSANNTADNAQNTAETSTESTGSADSAEKPVLTVGMEGTYAPYTYHDENGTLTGSIRYPNPNVNLSTETVIYPLGVAAFAFIGDIAIVDNTINNATNTEVIFLKTPPFFLILFHSL